MVYSDDSGTKLIIYGRLESNFYSNELFILDIPTRVWSAGPSTPKPRIYMACTLAGDQFIAWGGIHSSTEMASSDAMVFSMANNSWIDQYTPRRAIVQWQ
ncbi:hypothetical protein BGW39_007563 [Mortierella sp. 14UC]|nr:hypothetical protein BGW39_007563 [Mortierella sp. 14UC]